MHSVWPPAGKKPGKQIAALAFAFFRQRGLVGACAKGDFVRARKGGGREAVAHPCELQPMQQQADFGRGSHLNLYPLPRRLGDE